MVGSAGTGAVGGKSGHVPGRCRPGGDGEHSADDQVTP